MKTLLTLALMATLIGCKSNYKNVQKTDGAVVTADCPETIFVKVSDFEKLDPSDIEDYEYYLDDNMALDPSREYLDDLEPIDEGLALTRRNTSSSRCEYQGDDNQELTWHINAILAGSTRENAVNKAHLRVYYSVTNYEHFEDALGYVFYFPIEEVTPEGLKAKETPIVNVYHEGDICSWGDCALKHIRIGKATTFEVK